jgi:FkbM family methyltransferase
MSPAVLRSARRLFRRSKSVRPIAPDGTARAIYRRLSSAPVRTIFDVGANVGDMAKAFSASFPEAKVYCFEPVAATFEILSENLKSNMMVSRFCTAIGSHVGTATIEHGDQNWLHRIRPNPVGPSEQVKMTTVDAFCEGESIPSIDILKSDTEGYELEVFAGASRMLLKTRFVLVEFGISTKDEQHVPFDAIYDRLHPLGFSMDSVFGSGYAADGQFIYGNAFFHNRSLSLS